MTSEMQMLAGLSAVLIALVGIVLFAFLRFRAAARRLGQDRLDSSENAFVTTALHEAVARLRDKEQAQQARADESERLSEEIVAGLTSGLLVVTADGRARIVNPAARLLLDLPEGATRSAGASETPTYADLLAHVPPLAAAIEETLRTRQPTTLRRAIDLRPFSLRAPAAHLGVTISPILHADGRFQGLICLCSDLTAVVQLEEQLRLRASLAQVGEMTAGIAHEFRNSLATIHGYARLIDVDALSPRDRTCVEGIRQETSALGEVLTNFLHFARPADITMERVDLGSVLERALDEVRAEVSARGGTLRPTGMAAADARVYVEGDEVLLRQAFGNLCRNALEACASHGIAPEIAVALRVDETQPHALVTVSDNGPGVEPIARERIFQPFFTTKAKGTGLGLALVQKIVVTHNGRITPSHPPGGGLHMEIALPLDVSAPSPSTSSSRARSPHAESASPTASPA